jgi:hypothetical protein
MQGPIANIVLAEADTNSEDIHESEAAEKGKEQRFETGTASES